MTETGGLGPDLTHKCFLSTCMVFQKKLAKGKS